MTWQASPDMVLDLFREAWDLGLSDAMLRRRHVRFSVREIRLITQGRVYPELFRVTDMGKGWFHVSEAREGAAVYRYRLAAPRNPLNRVRRALG